MRMRNDHRVDSPLIRSRTADTRLEFPATRIFEFERVSSRMETTISRCIPDGNTGNEPSPEISRLLDRLLFIPLEFLPNFHACSRYFGNTRRFLKRGNFAVNFRQGPVLISTSDIIETRLYTSWDRIWTSNRMGDEKFYEERIFEKVCFVKEKFRRSWKFKEFRETL